MSDLDFFARVHDPRKWHYVPPPWIEPLHPEFQLYFVFNKLFSL